MNYVWAFVAGGLICVVGQLFIDYTKLSPARILTGYVVAGVILSAVGLYKPLVDFAGAGASVPLLGFGHLLAQGVRTAEAEVVSEAVPVDAASVEPGIALYFIQPGESAWDVAKRYRVPLSELQQLNPELPDQPRPGTPVIAYRR